MKDYLQFLDIGIKSHRTYPLANPAGAQGRKGVFSINLKEITAITLMESC